MKIEITGRRFEVEDKLRDYVEEKIGGLEKYLPRATREAATVTVVLEEDASGREGNRFVAEGVLVLGGETLVSREGTMSMFAAVDIVEEKLKAQCVKYKDRHVEEPRHKRMVARLMGERDGDENSVES